MATVLLAPPMYAPSMPPLHKPSPPPRVAVRKGSISAPDPFVRHASADTPRNVKSRLTIMRLPQDSPLDEIPTIALGKPRQLIPEYKSNSVSKLKLADPSPGRQRPIRLSFAKTSFSPAQSDTSSPPSSPDLDRRSPGPQYSPKSRSNSFSARPNLVRRPTLSAQQICDIAASSLTAISKAPTADPAISLSPFKVIPASCYLPFLDRPPEVSALLDHPSNALLMTLISRTFPSHLRTPVDNTPTIDTLQNIDPKQWSYPALYSYIRTCPRDVADDIEWVSKTRQCVKSRSEIMWARLKQVIGVPPELDEDDPFYVYINDLEEAVDLTEDIEDHHDEGVAGRHSEAATDSLNDAWLEPIKSGSVQMFTSPTTMTGSGMEVIGESEEEAVAAEEGERDCHDDNGGVTTEQKEEVFTALRLQTGPSYVAGVGLPSKLQDVGLAGYSGQPSRQIQYKSQPQRTITPSHCHSISHTTPSRRNWIRPLFPGSFHGIDATVKSGDGVAIERRESEDGSKPLAEKVTHAGVIKCRDA